MAVLAQAWTRAHAAFTEARAAHSKSDVADDDILDAMVLFLTACQPRARLRTVGAQSDRDSAGLPMRMVYSEVGKMAYPVDPA